MCPTNNTGISMAPAWLLGLSMTLMGCATVSQPEEPPPTPSNGVEAGRTVKQPPPPVVVVSTQQDEVQPTVVAPAKNPKVVVAPDEPAKKEVEETKALVRPIPVNECNKEALTRTTQKVKRLLDMGNGLWPSRLTVRARAKERFSEAYDVWEGLPGNQKCLSRRWAAEAKYRKAQITTHEAVEGEIGSSQKLLNQRLVNLKGAARLYVEVGQMKDPYWSPRGFEGAGVLFLDFATAMRKMRLPKEVRNPEADAILADTLEHSIGPIEKEGIKALEVALKMANAYGDAELVTSIEARLAAAKTK